MPCVKNIAVVGATGTIGKYIVAELLKTGKHTLTALTRTDSTAEITQGPNVKVAKIDYADPSTLVSALRGQQVLIITLPMFAPNELQLKLVAAAAEAGVDYIVPNNWANDPTHISADEAFVGPGRREIREAVEKAGKSSWVDFVSGLWYTFSLSGGTDRFGFDFQKNEVVFYDDGMSKINTTTWEQTARAVAKVFSLEEEGEGEGLTLSKLKNKAVYHSSFLVSQRDMFESVLRVTGTKEEDWKISYESSAERYGKAAEKVQQGDMTPFIRALYARLFYPEDSGYASSAFERTHGLYNEVLGLPKEDLDAETKIAIENSKTFSYL